jgi:hypothetical protein
VDVVQRAGVTGLAVILAVVFAPAAAAASPSAGVPLREAIVRLTVAAESREGYLRDKFRHWTDADRDGCSTRAEVLIEEAVLAPAVGARCTLTGGSWHSAYDDVYVADAARLDIDHMVPLAEAWDSGASAWTAQRRQAYANDVDEPRALIAVSAATNRSKADQDPREWLPPFVPGRCRYLVDWVAVKTRWSLSVDEAERLVLTELAAACPNVPIDVAIVAPSR